MDQIDEMNKAKEGKMREEDKKGLKVFFVSMAIGFFAGILPLYFLM